MSEPTLYHFPMSFYSQKVKLYLLEKGVKFHEQHIFLFLGDQLRPSFLRMNPKAQVPVFKNGEEVVSDASEIYFYCEEHLVGKCLLPIKRKDEVLSLHKKIHSVASDVITYGCVFNPELTDHMQLTDFMRLKMKEAVQSKYLLKVVGDLCATAPPDLHENYMKKMDIIDHKIDDLCSREKLEESLTVVEKVLDICESQLTRSHNENKKAPDSLLFGREPTIADIDLAVLLARLKLLGLWTRLFNSTSTAELYYRPHLQRFFSCYKQKLSFQKAIQEPQEPGYMERLFFRRRMRDNAHWMVVGGCAVMGAAFGLGYWWIKS